MTNYFLQRNVSERYAQKKPLKEMARTLLAEKVFCGGGYSKCTMIIWRKNK